MSSVAFLLVPLLALGGVWALLTAYDGSAPDRLRLTRIGAGCLIAALLAAGLGMVLDRRSPDPAPTGTSTSV